MSLAFMVIAAACIGWGCSYDCRAACELNSEEPQTTCNGTSHGISLYATSGDCYEMLAYLPMVAGCTSGIVCLACTIYARASSHEAQTVAWQIDLHERWDKIEAEIAYLAGRPGALVSAKSRWISARQGLPPTQPERGRAGEANETGLQKEIVEINSMVATASTFASQAITLLPHIYPPQSATQPLRHPSFFFS